MSPFRRVSDHPSSVGKPKRVGLDERFLAQFFSETPLDRVESQELRQQVMAALRELTRDELHVVELRFQHKKSPGQVASKLQMDRKTVVALERSALEKIRTPIAHYLES